MCQSMITNQQINLIDFAAFAKFSSVPHDFLPCDRESPLVQMRRKDPPHGWRLFFKILCHTVLRSDWLQLLPIPLDIKPERKLVVGGDIQYI